jgi:hypothetical protein
LELVPRELSVSKSTVKAAKTKLIYAASVHLFMLSVNIPSAGFHFDQENQK